MFIADETEMEKECVSYFKIIYNLWKVEGVATESLPTPNAIKWLNSVIAFLFLVMDICQIEKSKIREQYLMKITGIEADSWNYSLHIRFLDFIMNVVKELDQRGNGWHKIKAHFQKELSSNAE